MRILKRVYIGITILSAMFLFAACGKAKKGDIADDLSENAGISSGAGTTEAMNETDEIPENISYTVEVGGKSLKVDAKIYADGYGNISTFTAKECEDKDEWVLNYATKLFDNGEYIKLKPIWMMGGEELEAELQVYEERYSQGITTSNEYEIFQIKSMLEHYGEENEGVDMDNKIVYPYEGIVDDEENGIESTSVHSDAYLRGYVDGRMWNLYYHDGYKDTQTVHQIDKTCIVARCIDEEYNFNDASGISETYINNLCHREDAEKKAKDLLQKLGFDNMELLHIVQNNLQSTEADGYTMVFGMSENGAHLLFGVAGGETFVESASTEEHNATQPYVEVMVNSNGIYQIIIMGNYNEPEIMTEESAMLSFEQINEIAKEELKKQMENSDKRNFGKIDTIEFGYVYITYDGLSYAIVPAWRYYHANGDRNEIERNSCLTICALDGSIIYSGMAAFDNMWRKVIVY